MFSLPKFLKSKKTMQKELKKEEEKNQEKLKAKFEEQQLFNKSNDNTNIDSEKLDLKASYQKEIPIPASASGSSQDSGEMQGGFSIGGTVNPVVLNYIINSSSFVGYSVCEIIAQQKLISKAIQAKAKDAVKKWFSISAVENENVTDEQIKIIKSADEKMGLREHLVQAIKFNNIFGIRHILFKNKDPDFDYEKEFNLKDFEGGQYAGIVQIDPHWITPVLEDADLSDPTSDGYLKPTFWQVAGKRIHKSHFVILEGDTVSSRLKPTYNYGGISLVQKLYQRVFCAETVSDESVQLVKTKRLYTREADLNKNRTKEGAKTFKSNSTLISRMLNSFGFLLVNKDEKVQKFETNLAGLDEVVMLNYQVIALIADIPIIKLMNTSPKGFSNGDGENKMYIESVEELQGNEMLLIAKEHHKRVIASNFGTDKFNIDVNWNPLNTVSEVDLSTINLNRVNADAVSIQSGIIDEEEGRGRLNSDKNSGYNNLEKIDASSHNE